MTSRRAFLKTSTFAAAGLLVRPSLLTNKPYYLGLQLYTVRDAMLQDPSRTLARVAKIGYNAVEGATYTGTQQFYGMKAAAFAQQLRSNGLIMPSSHYRLGMEKENGAIVKGTLLHEWNRAVDDAAAVGVKYMVCAFLSPEERGNIAHYRQLAEQFNKAGEVCKKAGIQFCYHNHDFEFEAIDGQLPYDILLNDTDKDLVKMEMDIYWVARTGRDPLSLMQQHPGRFPLWHVKDMDNTPAHAFTEVGNGVINFKKIFTEGPRTGLKYFFVEQDQCPGSPFDSITKSIGYIRKHLV